MDQDSKKLTRYGAYGIIFEDSKLLLTQKKSGPYKGLWGLPGGAIEFGETPEQTLKREILEETALVSDQLKLLTVMTNFGDYINNEQEYKIHHIGIIYRVNVSHTSPDIIPEEKMRWVAIHQIVSEELTPFAKQANTEKFFGIINL